MFGRKQATKEGPHVGVFHISDVDTELAVAGYLRFMDAFSRSYQSDDCSKDMEEALNIARESLKGYGEMETAALGGQIDPSHFIVKISQGAIPYHEFGVFLGHMAIAASATELNGRVDPVSMHELAEMGGRLDISDIIRLDRPDEQAPSFGM